MGKSKQRKSKKMTQAAAVKNQQLAPSRRQGRSGSSQRQPSNGITTSAPVATSGIGPSRSLGPLGGAITVEEVEHLGAFTRGTTAAGQTRAYLCMPSSLIRLSNIARCFARWRPLQWSVFYVPEVGTQTNGAIQMAYLYDYGDSLPTTTGQISACSGFLTAAVWCGAAGAQLLSGKAPRSQNLVIAHMDCKRSEWMRVVDGLTDTDPAHVVNTYLPARAVVRSSLLPATEDTPGQLYVRYRIMLRDAVAPGLNDASSSAPSVDQERKGDAAVVS
uniref:Capsid protein n=1 Tax=Imperata yellow mottle virus TaxID=524023 RepID=A0A2R4KP24_9VIRU|nr:capsid protein [Imperata yellow mottle virus]AVV62469.1 capsid protein [Imperata yellow mottle virus]AVV62478.1 capsid protein [Imperata yellow mottle virus]